MTDEKIENNIEIKFKGAPVEIKESKDKLGKNSKDENDIIYRNLVLNEVQPNNEGENCETNKNKKIKFKITNFLTKFLKKNVTYHDSNDNIFNIPHRML